MTNEIERSKLLIALHIRKKRKDELKALLDILDEIDPQGFDNLVLNWNRDDLLEEFIAYQQGNKIYHLVFEWDAKGKLRAINKK